MKENQLKFHLLWRIIISFASLIILADFILPGKIITDEIIDLKKERQQYYNAARNYHYTYEIVTKNNTFLVSENFANSIQDQKKIQYSLSKIFQKVNWYKFISSNNNSFSSFRITTGLVLPMLTIILICVAFRFKKNLTILIFVFQLLVIADIIFLLV